MRPETVLLIYGEGGHRAQMRRLYKIVQPHLERRKLEVVGICENNDSLSGIENYSQGGLRDKHSHLKAIITIPAGITRSLILCLRLITKYRVVGIISTGPGIAIIPSIIFKVAGAKIVFLESWSRFDTRSTTGSLMYYLADLFYVQHKSTQRLYPKSKYGGLL